MNDAQGMILNTTILSFVVGTMLLRPAVTTASAPSDAPMTVVVTLLEPDPECTCLATLGSIDQKSTWKCNDGTVGVSIVWPNPTTKDGVCLANCSSGVSPCEVIFPDVDVNFFNCLEGGYTESPQYNDGVRVYNDSDVYDLSDTTECKDDLKTHKDAKIDIYDQEQGGTSLVHVHVRLECAKCEEVE